MARITHAKTTPTIGLTDWNADHVLEDVADASHTHDNTHDHDGDYAAPHSHPYAEIAHDHNAEYEAIGHTHDTIHNHDASYAGTAHTHDTTHDHDSDYAPVHAHPYSADDHSHDLTAYATDADLTAHAATPHGGESGEAFPVGSLFLSTVATNPASLLGYGTWSAYGDGRLLMSSDTAGQTGGSSTHTHADHTGVISHTHVVNRFPTATGGSVGFTVDTSMSGTQNATGLSTATPAGAVNALTHDSPSHLPPYITVHVWERTA